MNILNRSKHKLNICKSTIAVLLAMLGLISLDGLAVDVVSKAQVAIYYDTNEASITFAAQDLKNILVSKGTNATLKIRISSLQTKHVI